MNRALAAILTVAILTPTAVSAQSYVESNARDAICEWSFKKQTGISKCHIVAMGSHGTDSLVMMFEMNGAVYFLDEYHGKKTAHIGSGGFWDFKSQWKGSYKESSDLVDNNEESAASVSVYKLSNGYKIKMVY